MGLVKAGAVRRVDVADGWIEVKASVSVRELIDIVGGDRELSALVQPTPHVIQKMLHSMIVAWSYEDPVTPENIDRLELETMQEVIPAISEIIGSQSPKGTNGSTPSDEENGPTISGTSQ